MSKLTERQEWILAYAIRHDGWIVGGKGGMSVARGLEGRGLGTVRFEQVPSCGLCHVFHASDEGRAFAKRHKVTVVAS